MKKLLAMLAFAAAMFISCDPNDPDDPDDSTGKTEYKQPITIDGDFADWAALDASKVQVVKCAKDAEKKDLKLAKVYADKYFVFIYLEFDYSAYDGEVSMAHVDFMIDGDASATTGGYASCWNMPQIDVLLEGSVIEDGAVCEAFEAPAFLWSGGVGEDGWLWTEVEGLTGFVEGKGTKQAWEFRITRELYPNGKLAKEFNLGILTTVNGWDCTGFLPNADVNEANPSGFANLLTVNQNK